MGTKDCWQCNNAVDLDASACSHCGAALGRIGAHGIAERRRHPLTRALIYSGIGLAGIFASLVVLGGVLNALHRDGTGSRPGNPREGARPFGDEIACRINTATDPSFNIGFNTQIKDPRAFVERSQGVLTLTFDMAPSFPLRNHILIRGFDRNGQHLFHFVTQEQYSSVPGDPLPPLKVTGNVLRYPINLRDAQFIGMIEVGFVGLG